MACHKQQRSIVVRVRLLRRQRRRLASRGFVTQLWRRLEWLQQWRIQLWRWWWRMWRVITAYDHPGQRDHHEAERVRERIPHEQIT